MFTKISPQKVISSDGYTVQVANKNHVEYIEPTCRAEIEVDFGTTVGVYPGTLRSWTENAQDVPTSTSEQSLIVKRIVAGLEAMGSKVEIC